MRKVVHRLLSGAPSTVLALGAIWGTAFPEKAEQAFQNASDTLSNPWMLWASICSVGLYAGLWWLTSREEKPARERFREQLLPIYSRMDGFRKAIIYLPASTPVEELLAEVNAEMIGFITSVEAKMGPAAVAKFRKQTIQAADYNWPNLAPEEAKKRTRAVLSLEAYLADTKDLLESGAWDPPEATWQKKLVAAKNRLFIRTAKEPTGQKPDQA